MRNRSKSLHAPAIVEEEDDHEDEDHEDEDQEEDDHADHSNKEFADVNLKTLETRVMDGWTPEEENTLVANVKKQRKQSDLKHKYTHRIDRIDWDEVAFGRLSAENCKNHFKGLLKRVRKFRNFDEIIQDIESKIAEVPYKKPPSSYQIYLKDIHRRNAGDGFGQIAKYAELYKKLSPHERKKYDDQAKQVKAEYIKKMNEFYKENPKTAELVAHKSPKKAPVKKLTTPFMLFRDYNKLLGIQIDTQQIRQDYLDLPMEDAFKWIRKSVKMHPNAELKDFLNKDEIRIYQGNFRRPPTGYALFCKEVYPLIKDDYKSAKETLVAIATKWKNLDSERKEEYLEKSKQLMNTHKSEVKTFIEKHAAELPGAADKKKGSKKLTVSSKDKNKSKKSTDDEEAEPSTSQSAVSKKAKKSKKEKKVKAETEEIRSPIKKARTSFSEDIPDSEVQFTSPREYSINKTEKEIHSKTPRKNSLTSSIVSSSGTEDNGRKRKKSSREESPISSASSLKSTKRLRTTTETSEMEFANPSNSRLALAKSPTRESILNKSSKKDATPAKKKSNGQRSSQEESGTETPMPKQGVKREQSLDINDVHPPTKPPSTEFKYYSEIVFKGKPSKAQKAFDNLKKSEKKAIKTEYQAKVECYVRQLKVYLSSLSKDDAVSYIKQIKQQEANATKSPNSKSKQKDSSEETGSSSSSGAD